MESIKPVENAEKEAWLDNLADVLAEAIVYLGQRGMLPLTDDPIPGIPEPPRPVKKRNVIKSS